MAEETHKNKKFAGAERTASDKAAGRNGGIERDGNSVKTVGGALLETVTKSLMSKSDRLTLRASKLAYENRNRRLG